MADLARAACLRQQRARSPFPRGAVDGTDRLPFAWGTYCSRCCLCRLFVFQCPTFFCFFGYIVAWLPVDRVFLYRQLFIKYRVFCRNRKTQGRAFSVGYAPEYTASGKCSTEPYRSAWCSVWPQCPPILSFSVFPFLFSFVFSSCRFSVCFLYLLRFSFRFPAFLG